MPALHYRCRTHGRYTAAGGPSEIKQDDDLSEFPQPHCLSSCLSILPLPLPLPVRADPSLLSRDGSPMHKGVENRAADEGEAFVWNGGFPAIQNQALDAADMSFSFSFEFEGSLSYDYYY